MPWFSGGGGGGLTSVTTDGVTIQGNGTGGSPVALKAVQTSARLTGAGTVASPLDIAGEPVAGFLNSARLVTPYVATANKLYLIVIPIGYAFTFSHLNFYVGAADATHNSDVGVYNSAGTLIANVGAATYAATGLTTAAVAQGTVVEPPGLYGLAFTSAASTFALDGDNGGTMALFANAAYGTSVGGVLPNSITFPAIAPSNFSFMLSGF